MDFKEVKDEVNKIAVELADDLGIIYHWENNRLIFRRLGLNGYIEISNSEVRIKVEKNFFVPVSDEWIRNHVEARLNQHIR
jgi:putative polyhydroxyalkanoate system protein